MKKRSVIASILACSMLIVCMLSMPTIAFASGDDARIHDSYDRLTDLEELRINEAIKTAEKTVNATFIIEIYDESKVTILPSGEKILDSFGFSTKDNVVVLVIHYHYDAITEMLFGESYAHNYQMYTYGIPHKEISDSEVDAILDNENVYNNIKKGNYADGIVAFVEEAVKAMPKAVKGTNSNTSDKITSEKYTKIYGIILGVGGVVFYGGIIISYIIRKRRGAHSEGSSVRSVGTFGSYGGFGGSSGGFRGGR